MNDEPKPGWKTTEGWLAALHLLFSVAVSLGLMSLADSATLDKSVTNGVTAGVALVTSATVVWKYIASRTELKKGG